MKTTLHSEIADSRIRWLLVFAFLIQLLFCTTQVGFLHPDQHFQLIEFSSWQLGQPSGAASVWELTSQIRPTLQVYLFSGFVEVCQFLHIDSAYSQLLILRVLFGLLGFVLFNSIAFHYFKDQPRQLFLVLLLLNFSWTLPYIRTLFSSEMASSIAFFGALLLYGTRKQQTFYLVLIGFLFSLAFYFRFQMAFALVGFGIWMLLIEKNYARLLPMATGFALGIGLNILLDYSFYHQFVFTPYSYYRVNITEGKAAEFGTSSFLFYIVMLTLVIGTPPFSLFLFYYSLKAALKQYRQPLVFAVVFFVVGHSFVGHKEERFLFPVLNVLPIIAGWGLPVFIEYYQTHKRVQGFLKGMLYTSLTLTGVTLLFFITNPYSQSLEFSRRLVNSFSGTPPTIYCLNRTPFETENHLPLTFYRRSAQNLNLIRISNADSIRYLKQGWLATTYNDAKDKLPLIDSLGFKPQLYSSTAFWKINEFLQSKNTNTINEIWVLYKKE